MVAGCAALALWNARYLRRLKTYETMLRSMPHQLVIDERGIAGSVGLLEGNTFEYQQNQFFLPWKGVDKIEVLVGEAGFYKVHSSDCKKVSLKMVLLIESHPGIMQAINTFWGKWSVTFIYRKWHYCRVILTSISSIFIFMLSCVPFIFIPDFYSSEFWPVYLGFFVSCVFLYSISIKYFDLIENKFEYKNLYLRRIFGIFCLRRTVFISFIFMMALVFPVTGVLILIDSYSTLETSAHPAVIVSKYERKIKKYNPYSYRYYVYVDIWAHNLRKRKSFQVYPDQYNKIDRIIGKKFDIHISKGVFGFSVFERDFLPDPFKNIEYTRCR